MCDQTPHLTVDRWLELEKYPYSNRPRLPRLIVNNKGGYSFTDWLGTCLRKLRFSGLPQSLWVDTLCQAQISFKMEKQLNEYLKGRSEYPSAREFALYLLHEGKHNDTEINSVLELGGFAIEKPNCVKADQDVIQNSEETSEQKPNQNGK